MSSLPLYYSRPVVRSEEEERKWRKNRLAAGFRIFHDLGYGEGVAGHITVRDPVRSDCFWVNPAGHSFHNMTSSDLLLVDSSGQILEGNYAVNDAAFAIHSEIGRASCRERV